jgi:hypothetical protein
MSKRPVLRSSLKGWTAEDDERLRELLLKGMDAREVGYKLGRTATAVRSRGHRLNILVWKPIVSRSTSWERKLGLVKHPAETASVGK